MELKTTKKSAEEVAKYADMFSAMGTEARLRIVQLLLSAHPAGLVVGEIQEELDIPNSTLSHHLDKLKAEGAAQELKGDLQKAVGDAKAAVKDGANKAAAAANKNL